MGMPAFHPPIARRAALALAVATLALLAAPPPAPAQQRGAARDEEDSAMPAPPPTTGTRPTGDGSRGQVAGSAAGRAGQRRTRLDVTGVVATARIDTRVANRVQARLRNRIDRYFDPQANATSPFKVAGEQTQRQGQTRR